MTRHRQSDEERAVALRRALENPATPWGEVLGRLAFWPLGRGLEEATEQVEAVVERWPAATRAPTRIVLQQLLNGEIRPYLRLLRVLDLRPLWRVRDRDGLLRRIIRDGSLRELHTFRARYSDGDALLTTLVRSIRGLHTLYLGGSTVSPAGAYAIARSPAMSGLRHLSLHNNQIGDVGAEALLASPYLHGLRWLNLYRNGISHDLRDAIRSAPQWQRARLILH